MTSKKARVRKPRDWGKARNIEVLPSEIKYKPGDRKIELAFKYVSTYNSRAVTNLTYEVTKMKITEDNADKWETVWSMTDKLVEAITGAEGGGMESVKAATALRKYRDQVSANLDKHLQQNL